MNANPSRTVRARTTRRAAPYVPSPASSSSFSSSRRRQWGVYSLGFSESAISPVVSTLRPSSSTAGLAPVVEPRSWTQLPQVMDADTCDGAPEYLSNFISPPTEFSARASQHNHLFDQRHIFSFPQITPTDGLSQISKVPSLTYYPHTPTGLHTNDALLETVPSAYPSSSWDSSTLTGDFLSNPASQTRGVRFFDISAGFTSQDPGRSQAVPEPQQSAPANYYHPFAVQGWAAPDLQGPARPQVGVLGEQAVFHAQSSSGGLQSQQIPRQAAPIPRRHNPHHRPHLLRDAPYHRGAPLPYPGRSLSNSQL
ncbi:hypothetical protein BD779DRAFT_1676364 [Infundibulicybe gibba]|nr:hypothetical protein BD779DRAFT_1676364 [Infundibulicybe gibba]